MELVSCRFDVVISVCSSGQIVHAVRSKIVLRGGSGKLLRTEPQFKPKTRYYLQKRLAAYRQMGHAKRASFGDVEVTMTPKMTSALLKVTGFIMEQPRMAETTSARPYMLLVDELHQS